MPPGVCCTAPATPSVPLPPIPTGHCTEVPAPTFDFQSAFTFDRNVVKWNVVPLPSDR